MTNIVKGRVSSIVVPSNHTRKELSYRRRIALNYLNRKRVSLRTLGLKVEIEHLKELKSAANAHRKLISEMQEMIRSGKDPLKHPLLISSVMIHKTPEEVIEYLEKRTKSIEELVKEREAFLRNIFLSKKGKRIKALRVARIISGGNKSNKRKI